MGYGVKDRKGILLVPDGVLWAGAPLWSREDLADFSTPWCSGPLPWERQL